MIARLDCNRQSFLNLPINSCLALRPRQTEKWMASADKQIRTTLSINPSDPPREAQRTTSSTILCLLVGLTFPPGWESQPKCTILVLYRRTVIRACISRFRLIRPTNCILRFPLVSLLLVILYKMHTSSTSPDLKHIIRCYMVRSVGFPIHTAHAATAARRTS